MNVYLEPTTDSRGIMRVRDALVKYRLPKIRIVDKPSKSDFEIIHVYGRRDGIKRRVDDLVRQGKPFAMIQYVLKSSMSPSCWQWIYMWQRAKVVWSYYDLIASCKEDGLEPGQKGSFEDLGNFYYAPLGVDATVFKDERFTTREIEIIASGKHALSEGVRECAFAVKRCGLKMVHLGHELRRGDDIICKTGVSDEELATIYSQCRFVSGLRRVEGFELPIIEGAMCGCRPIVFDRPEMRHWFGDFAVFIKETDRGGVIDQLEAVFKGVSRTTTYSERKAIRHKFNWETIVRGFWSRIV